MSCIPESGGCERSRTDPFANHLNEVQSTHYIHMACLDRIHRNTPQPEALYEDQASCAQLVIERKSVVWPPDYAAQHRNDHTISDAVAHKLANVVQVDLLSIQLEPAPKMPRHELLAFAHAIADLVEKNMVAILSGWIIGSRAPGRAWSCYYDRAERFADGEPLTGIKFQWSQPAEPVHNDEMPQGLIDVLREIFQSSVRKFSGYSEARRILLLEPFGTIQYMDHSWWSQALKIVPIPDEVSEVWLASYDWITDHDQAWNFAQLSPISEPSVASPILLFP